jgi:hypothetical protein
MTPSAFPAAPASGIVKVATTLAVIVLLAIALSFSSAGARHSLGPMVIVAMALPPIIITGTLLYAVRGYDLEGSTLRVQRLLWVTELRMGPLERAWHDAKAMSGSMRLWGNGGLFAITGWFRNSKLGRYRAFVTNPGQAVVLRSAAGTIVVSPAVPLAFLSHLRSHVAGIAIGPPGS